MNLVDFAIDGIKDPLQVLLSDYDFCLKYKIGIGSLLVIGEEYSDGEVVLADLGGSLILAYIQIDETRKLLISLMKPNIFLTTA